MVFVNKSVKFQIPNGCWENSEKL